MIDITTGGHVPMIGRASTPNEIAIAKTAMPNGTPRRIPAFSRARSDSVRSGGEVTVTGAGAKPNPLAHPARRPHSRSGTLSVDTCR